MVKVSFIVMVRAASVDKSIKCFLFKIIKLKRIYTANNKENLSEYFL